MQLPGVGITIPSTDNNNVVPEAPKDNNLYGRKNGKWENVHLEEIDGGTADPTQTLIIDGGHAFNSSQ